MKRIAVWLVCLLLTGQAVADCGLVLRHELPMLRSETHIDLCAAAAGKTLLVVNTASRCGYTPQFKALETLHQKYREQGLVVLGIPSNDFRQEYSSAEDTAKVCYVNYGVTFTMAEKQSVKGPGAHPLYKDLFRITGKEPQWNFNKFLVRPDGTVSWYPAMEQPLGSSLERDIRQSLR